MRRCICPDLLAWRLEEREHVGIVAPCPLGLEPEASPPSGTHTGPRAKRPTHTFQNTLFVSCMRHICTPRHQLLRASQHVRCRVGAMKSDCGRGQLQLLLCHPPSRASGPCAIGLVLLSSCCAVNLKGGTTPRACVPPCGRAAVEAARVPSQSRVSDLPRRPPRALIRCRCKAREVDDARCSTSCSIY